MLLKKEEVVELFQKINGTGKTKENIGNKKKYISQCDFEKIYYTIYSYYYDFFSFDGI